MVALKAFVLLLWFALQKGIGWLWLHQVFAQGCLQPKPNTFKLGSYHTQVCCTGWLATSLGVDGVFAI